MVETYSGYLTQAAYGDGVSGWWMRVVRTAPAHEGFDYQDIDWHAEPVRHVWMREDEFEPGSCLCMDAAVEIDIVGGRRHGRRSLPGSSMLRLLAKPCRSNFLPEGT